MLKKTIILYNNTREEIIFWDIGLTLDAGERRDITTEFDFEEVKNSEDLEKAVLSGDVIVSNSERDFKPEEGLEYIKLDSVDSMTYTFFEKLPDPEKGKMVALNDGLYICNPKLEWVRIVEF